ncbi:MAG: FGGY-family carbohydrate kinase [Clostridia bacterium]
MREPLILTFDIGTQSMRAMLVNKKGDILDFEQKRYERPYIARNPGWAEQRPDFYFDCLAEVANSLCKKRSDLISNIIAVTMTTIRDTVLCLDKDIKPLRDIVLWLDKREANLQFQLPTYKRMLFKLVKQSDTVDMQYRQSICNWIMENEPELWAKTYKFVMLPTYLNYKLTGVLKDSTANMIGHIPMDYKNSKWMSERGLTRCLFDVPMSKLCELVNPGDIIGNIADEVSEKIGLPKGLPLIVTGSDKSCETLGLSVHKKNQASLSFGTTATVQFATADYFEPMPFVPSYPSVVHGMYNPEIQIYRGYWMLSWFKKEFAAKEVEQAKELGISAEELLNKRLKEVPAGCDGLVLQPFWGPGVSNPNARGSIIGFSDVHTRIHIYRAIIEGIGFALIDGMKNMEKRGKQKITEVYVGGGGSQSDEICQITANMFGLTVKRIQTHEACGLGASMIAFKGMGEFKTIDEAIENMARDTDIFTPDENEHKIYTQLYENVYCKVYGKLEPLYKTIKRITRRDEI